MLELYRWEPNGCWLKPMIALHEKQLPFTDRYVDVLKSGSFAVTLPPSRETALNPEGEGPLLVHDGHQATESLFLIEYLEDAFPASPPLRPTDALGHVRILAWARFINEVFMPAANTLGCARYLASALEACDRAALEAAVAKLPPGLRRDGWRRALGTDYPAELLDDSRRKLALAVRRIEDALAPSGWLVGAAYSLADIDAFAICNALPSLAPDVVNAAGSPRLLDWLERIRARPAVRAALAMSRTGRPEEAFAPGPEHSRWG